MNKNTLITMAACLATIVVLAGIVVWAESRLSSSSKAAARQEVETIKQHRDALAAARARVAAKIKNNPNLLRAISREESWLELYDLSLTELAAVDKDYRGTIDPILEANSSKDEDKLFLAIKQAEEKSKAAEARVLGLEDRIKQLADVLQRADKMRLSEDKALTSAQTEIAQARATLSTLETKYGDEFRALSKREGWLPALEREEKTLATVKQRFDAEVNPLLKASKADSARKAIALLQQLSAKRSRAQVEAKVFVEALRALQHWIDNKAEYLARAQSSVAVVAKVDLRPAQDAAAKAALDFPRVEKRVKGDLMTLEAMPATAERLSANVVRLAAMKLTDPAFNPGQAVSDVKQLDELRNTAAKQVAAYQKLLDQLFVSWDKILSDLRIEEGQYVTFKAQYTTHRVDRNDKKTTTVEPWKKVDGKAYKTLEKQMGMVVESKPKGYFDSEAKKGVIPPGYTYVGDDHYGKWDNQGGHKVWVFHRRYHYMRPMFWGGHYRPIRYAHWSVWRAHPHRIYYGRDRFGHPRYGPRGTLTRRHYSGALFVRHGGWRTTRWYRTGGKFRGTHYERRRRSTVVIGGGSGPRYRGSSRSRGGSTYRRSYGK